MSQDYKNKTYEQPTTNRQLGFKLQPISNFLTLLGPFLYKSLLQDPICGALQVWPCQVQIHLCSGTGKMSQFTLQQCIALSGEGSLAQDHTSSNSGSPSLPVQGGPSTHSGHVWGASPASKLPLGSPRPLPRLERGPPSIPAHARADPTAFAHKPHGILISTSEPVPPGSWACSPSLITGVSMMHFPGRRAPGAEASQEGRKGKKTGVGLRLELSVQKKGSTWGLRIKPGLDHEGLCKPGSRSSTFECNGKPFILYLYVKI